jgi:hypothetical protein
VIPSRPRHHSAPTSIRDQRRAVCAPVSDRSLWKSACSPCKRRDDNRRTLHRIVRPRFAHSSEGERTESARVADCPAQRGLMNPYVNLMVVVLLSAPPLNAASVPSGFFETQISTGLFGPPQWLLLPMDGSSSANSGRMTVTNRFFLRRMFGDDRDREIDFGESLAFFGDHSCSLVRPPSNAPSSCRVMPDMLHAVSWQV